MIIKKTNQELLAESLIELLETKSLEKITIQNIADNCCLTRTTFYRYFKDKYELMNWIYYHEIQSFLDEHPDIFSWKDLLNVVAHFIKNNSVFFKNIIDYKGQNSFEDFLFSYGSTYCINHILNFTNEKELSSEDSISITIYIGGTMKAFFEWIKRDCDTDSEIIAKIMSECMPHPLMKYFKNEL